MFLLPALDGGFISLGSPTERLLETQPALFENPPYLGGVIRDAKLSPDHFRHPRLGPQVPLEPEGLGPLGHKVGEACPLLPGQPGRSARGLAVPERFYASFPGPFYPLADSPSTHPQRLGDILLLPTLLV